MLLVANHIVVRSWCARRIVSKLRNEAVLQFVAMETMMRSVVMSDQWDRQYDLQRIDCMMIEDQYNLVAVMIKQVIELKHFNICSIVQSYR